MVAKGRPRFGFGTREGGLLVALLFLVANCSGVTLSLSRFWLRNLGIIWWLLKRLERAIARDVGRVEFELVKCSVRFFELCVS